MAFGFVFYMIMVNHGFVTSNGKSSVGMLHGRIHIVFSLRSLLYEYFNRGSSLRRRVAGPFSLFHSASARGRRFRGISFPAVFAPGWRAPGSAAQGTNSVSA